MLRSLLRPITAFAGLVGLAAYAVIMLRGPQGITALQDKQQQVRTLEEQNADLEHDIELKKQRIQRLETDRGTQELEIRKRLRLGRDGDTQFVLPEQPKSGAPR